MGFSRSKVRGKINLARPEAGVTLKGSAISKADPSGTFKARSTAVWALLPLSLCMCLHDAGEEEGRWSFSRWMCEISDSRSQRFQLHYEPNGLDLLLENICTRCIGAQTNPLLPLCHLLSLFSLPVSFSSPSTCVFFCRPGSVIMTVVDQRPLVLFFLLKPCLKHLDRLELFCPKTSTKSWFWTSGRKIKDMCLFIWEQK